jgi:hypothetical protein
MARTLIDQDLGDFRHATTIPIHSTNLQRFFYFYKKLYIYKNASRCDMASSRQEYVGNDLYDAVQS